MSPDTQQEILARHIADHRQARGVGLCIGASIDFLTGKQRRAGLGSKGWLGMAAPSTVDPRRLASRYLIECPRIFLSDLFEAQKKLGLIAWDSNITKGMSFLVSSR